MSELREVAGYAVACASPALGIFERDRHGDGRPWAAIAAAARFAGGADRTKAIRTGAWSALGAAREAREAGRLAAGEAARAAAAACGAAFLHPLAKSTQVRHILGPAAYAARALELAAGDDAVGAAHIEFCGGLATAVVIDVLGRYPPAPTGRGRPGELLGRLDRTLRARVP